LSIFEDQPDLRLTPSSQEVKVAEMQVELQSDLGSSVSRLHSANQMTMVILVTQKTLFLSFFKRRISPFMYRTEDKRLGLENSSLHVWTQCAGIFLR
jgi:hypothetical protein